MLADLRYAARSLIKKPGFAVLAIATLALGIGAALGAMRVLSALLFGIDAADVVTYLGVVLLLALAALLASYIPARRAMRVDPMVALRHE